MNRAAMLAILGALLAGGCATPPTRPPAPQPAAATTPGAYGQVIHVNERDRFCTVECAVLPSPGEEARVFRKNVVVGRIRFTPPVRFPYMTADVLEGGVAAGDRFEIEAPTPGAGVE